MQFNDVFFSTDNLFKPSLISFMVGVIFLIIFSYMKNQYNMSEKFLSNTIFSLMLCVFFIVRYKQSKDIVAIYNKKKKAKLKKREARETKILED